MLETGMQYVAGDCPSATPIQDFFKGSNILITGATGFVGKVLIEKLLRCCPDFETLYLLVREKKGKSVDSRIKELFEDEVSRSKNRNFKI